MGMLKVTFMRLKSFTLIEGLRKRKEKRGKK